MSDPRLYVWMALRRVDDGGMTRSAGAYFDRGLPAPGHLTEVFDQLIWAGFVAVAEGDALWELRRLSLTDAGQTRYATLCEQQREHVRRDHVMPPPEFGTIQTSIGRRSESLPPAPGDRSGPT